MPRVRLDGGVIGSLNTPTLTYTSGMWTMKDNEEYTRRGLWPLASPLPLYGSINVSALVVAGGAGGGGVINGSGASGGGGAGGLIYISNLPLTTTNYTITVGAGGAGGTNLGSNGTNGSNSSIIGSAVSNTSIGGGGGGGVPTATVGNQGTAGGSGGGGAGSNVANTGGAGTSGQGFAGGAGISTGSYYPGGGGGGSANNGGNASTTGGGAGGIGTSYNFANGTSIYYAGGGGGGSYNGGTPGTGGSGGGANGVYNAVGLNGTSSTGGGGGGTGATGTLGNNPGGAGGSGIVIVSYPLPQRWSGGTVTNNNGTNVVHTFTTSQTMTALAIPIDTYQPYNALLVHADGTNSSNTTVIIDSSVSAATFTNTGKPTQGTFSPFSTAGWSNYYSSTSSYLTFSDSSAGVFGTGDFTVECWILPSTSAHNIFTPLTTTNAFGLITSGNAVYWQFNGSNLTNGGTVPSNIWSHIAVVRSSSVTRIYLNGLQVASIADTNNYTGTTTRTIGSNGGTSGPLYISNARIIKGVAAYTGNFVPAISPLTANSVTTLLTAQSNYFIDNASSPNALTLVGTPQILPGSPFSPTSGYSNTTVGGSMYFGGSDYATSTGSASYSVGTGNFTIEFWLYMGGTSATGLFALNSIPGPNSASGLAIYLSASGVISFFVNGSGGATNSATGVILPNQWYHVALIRNGSTNTIYVNGVATSATNSTTPNPSASPAFGLARTYNDSFTAGSPVYISNLRVTSGIAVYTSFPFTPPTSALTANSTTLLLASGTNTGIADYIQKRELTTFGGASISTTQSQFGGSSMLFDGSSGYVKFNNSIVMGTQAYTMECWFYLNSTSFSPNFYPFIGTSTNSTSALDIRIFSTTTIQVDSNNSSTTTFTLPVTLTTGVWYHVAVTRDAAGNCNVWLNGVRSTSGNQTVSANYTGTTDSIGYVNGSPSAYFNGYIDEFRLTLGVARYTANFTPSSTSFLNT